MQKLLLSLVLFILCSFSVLPQVSTGPKFGLNFSNVIGGAGGAGNKFIIGFHAGAFLKIDINDAMAIQTEALYSTRGYKRHTSSAAGDTNLKYTFSYIDFPFLLHIGIGENAYLSIGPQVGYLINSREKGDVTVSNTTINIDANSVNGFNTTEYSLAIEGGYEFYFGLIASFRATYGILKLYKGDFTSHNLSFHVSAGYRFGGKEKVKSKKGVMYNKRR